MSPKGPHPWMIGLLVMPIAACLMANCQHIAYEGFLKRNVDYPKTDFRNNNNYCYEMMSRRGLKCQRSNTFIHASPEHLKSICNSKGRILEGKQTSKRLFPITICRRRKLLGKLFCRYKGKSKIKKIRVTCREGFPIRFISYV